jgi:hypothetical protein
VKAFLSDACNLLLFCSYHYVCIFLKLILKFESISLEFDWI